ncbi:hypothetical protein PPERSA_08922 [Pseudocohnilembus persalinus]|uniref:Uncharacterized protein n=1 Tax=Pseudocohnilembus persalinus TaxID=266149 RepID=A0A0V0R2T3_PSEPJ|nr:hypothetical protein PPERSA_08922 [Pseudocohnilembus persalinus]|eukprot:KRX08818.1 hypothetical protein PPERSA_08922 [Pseudocohnilembus persalinus]
MDAFMRKKEENQANKTGPVYDNSQYLKSLEMKDRQIKQELDDCDRLKEQLDYKLRKGEINHQSHLDEIKQKFGKKQNDFSKYIEKQKQQEKELEYKKIQSAAQTRHKQEFSAWLLKQEQEKKIQEKRKQDKYKAENIQHNLQRLQNEQEQKNAQLLSKLEQRTTKHARSQTQGGSSVKTLLELHLESKFKNDLKKKKQNQNLQQVIEQRQKESDYLQQKLQTSGEKKMIEEVRNKIRDYRLKARFQQSQGRYGQNFNQSVM